MHITRGSPGFHSQKRYSCKIYWLVATCQQVAQACQFHQVATSLLRSGLLQLVICRLVTPPARRARRSYKFSAFCFFGCRKLVMGYTAVQFTDCYSEPMSTRVLNSIFSRICRQNTQFNMYSTPSKQQEGCMFKDSLSINKWYYKCHVSASKHKHT